MHKSKKCDRVKSHTRSIFLFFLFSILFYSILLYIYVLIVLSLCSLLVKNFEFQKAHE